MFALRFGAILYAASKSSCANRLVSGRNTPFFSLLPQITKQHLKMSTNAAPSKKHSSSILNASLSSRVQISIVGNGANANPTAIAVHTDRETMLLNCGEGVQRLLFEHRVRIGKIRHVLFTNVRHDNFAGYFGFLLTVAPSLTESGQHLKIYAPSQFKMITQIYDRFMYHARDVKLSYRYVDRDNEEAEEGLNGGDESSNGVLQMHEEKLLLEDVDLALKSIPILETKQDSRDLAVAYVFVLKDKPGQLLVEKCKQLKVPPGPLFAKLKAGQEIEIDGRTIQPADVVGPPDVGPSFIILECPTQGHLQSLVKNGDFAEHLSGKHLELVIHITPSDVFADEQYQNWLAQFAPTTKHILLNRDGHSELSLISSSIAQVKLNLIDGQTFRMLNESQLEQFQVDQHPIIRNCPTMLTYSLRPSRDLGITFNPDFCRLNAEDIIREAKENANFVEQLEQFRAFASTEATSPTSAMSKCSLFNSKPNVLFLGTGSATPGKQRNTSAILVNLQPDTSMLFDCGEATFLQLNRFYGRQMCQSIVGSLKAIFISHNHADHHFGLIRLIREHSKLSPTKPLTLIAPECIGEFLSIFCSKVEDLSAHYELISCHELLFQRELSAKLAELKQTLLRDLSLAELVTVEVPHCYDSYGIVITTANQEEKIAYSGDSTFSNAFDKAGRDCSLLIHEATMNDDLREEATEKRHATISDAIQVGVNCNAKFTMLTHFSQRYAKIAPVDMLTADNPLANYTDNSVGIAFDFMQIELNQLRKVAKMKPLLETLFSDDIQDMQEKRTKKALKRKLIDEAIREIS